ncbi:ferrous iron transport protein B [Collinsella sp. OF02-10]|uniref:ferrous iron transport protein B n=1 Tax=unclassified Collinsella TaxID=2637548 RepID=UPI000E4CCA64|nr:MULTISPECIES: ferrous iron transport protein B [unclassified Collinsella]RGU68987.1 ferrous iron transport protein B [Collinsella sp. AF15-51]RGY35715.1 ferrous iron transport protein B [Collinsella sp. OF02-10]
MKLDTLEIGKDAVVASVASDDQALRQHILDMGLTPGTEVTMMKYAPMGDPLEIRLRGYELTLRKDDAARIELVGVHDTDTGPRTNAAIGMTEHPALGEGTYSPRAAKTAVPEGAPLHFALAGNQNCGKTTLFNQLTGSNQHVGNFPGVTVDRKDGTIRNHPEASVTDLPGIYSLSPYTGEEIVSRQFILDENPDAIIDIIDATNIERNLYLTLQLMELDRPMVIALNMMDEVTANGGAVDVNLLESLLGVPVVPISAARNEGIGELVDHALHVARFRERPGRLDFCAPDGSDGGALHRCIHGIANLIEDHAVTAHIPVRFAATKLVEGDELVTEALHLDRNELDAIEHIITQMEGEAGTDRLSALADMRFSFIGDVCGRCVVKPHESREHVRSVKIDRILTGRYTAIPAFLVIMGLVFWLTFGVIGAALQGLMEDGIAAVIASADAGLKAFGTNDVVRSLAVDGVLTGVGSVLTFLPIIVVLFLFLSILEDSGYMARVAFVMDKVLRRFGLSGRSFVPMLVGFGCTVPAIMSTRTLPSEHDRKMTVMLTPFMSCSAKLPVYGLLCGAFFPQATVPAMVSLYLIGIAVGCIAALVLNRTAFKGDPVPFIMELPNYRLPSVKTTVMLAWDKAKDFITKAFTIIFAATVVIWFLQTFDIRFNVVADQSQSLLASLGSIIAPVLAPLGFGDWRASTALVTGLIAKESVISTLTVLLGATSPAALSTMFSPFTAYVFLVFTLLYPPCVAAIGAVKSELGARYAVAVFAFQVTVAWIVAFVVHSAGILLGLA